MAYGTVNADVIQSSVSGVSLGAGNATNFKNRIINGDMRIDQRNAGASVTPTANGSYTLDRWGVNISQASKFSVQQNAGSVTPPAGFTNYFGATSLSAYSVGAGEVFGVYQTIEGSNVADLAWGTASAKTVTLSFWVRSSLTGTFGGILANGGVSYSYPFTYSIPVANTWTQISVTVAGPTAGTWLTTNGAGLVVQFSLGTGATYSGTAGAWASANYLSATGATSVVGTNGATWYVTGVQLEVGSSATGFEYRDYGRELAMCQRYYEIKDYSINTNRVAVVYTNGVGAFAYQDFAVTKRTSPSISWSSNGSGRYVSTVGVSGSQTVAAGYMSVYGTSYGTSGTFNASTGWIDNLGTMQISAEL